MNELITACLDSEDIGYLAEFPTELLSSFEAKVIAWAVTYTAKHDQVPSAKRAQTAFPEFVPIRAVAPLPLADIYQLSLKRRINEFALSIMTEAMEKVTLEGRIPIEELSNIIRIANIEAGVSKYSSFDRSLYFRKGKINLGIKLVDRAIGKLADGDYCLLVGRLGVGKSTVAQWIAHRWWQQDKVILYVSNESLPTEVFARLDGMSGGFNPLLLRSEDKESMSEALKEVEKRAKAGKGEIMIPVKRLSTPASVAAFAKSLPLDAIIIDGVYLMRPSEAGYSAKWERVAAVSNELKQNALDLGLPIIGVTQLKRIGKKEEIDVEDIAYSDALGQDADFVIALRQDLITPERIEVQLIKNRFGSLIGEVLMVDFDNMRIIEESIEGPIDSDKELRGKFLW